MTTRERLPWWITIALLIGILIPAFWLRWTYVQEVSLYVDEYITLRAARQILDLGLPLLPTGNFYSHGLLLSYIEAGIMALAGFDPLLARFPVLIFGLLTVVLAYWAGQRWFSSPVGLLAAALVALAPDAIIWSGRARMYAPLQFFVLLAVYLYWRCLDATGRWRDAVLFALCFLCAIFLHAETMILLPVLGLISLGAALPTIRQQGPLALVRHWWQKGLIAAWIAAALGVLVELWFRQLGPPMVSRLAAGVYGPSSRIYLQAAWDWPGIRKTLEPLLTSPAIWGLVGLLLLLVVYVALRRRRDPGPHLPASWRAPLTYLATVFGLSLLFLLFVTDPSWKSPRYLFMLLPIFYLTLSAAILGRAEQIQHLLPTAPFTPQGSGTPQAAGTPLRKRYSAVTVLAAALALVLVGSWPAARAAAREKVAGYDRAFEHVSAHYQPGEAVMTFVPQAALFYLGRSDYLTVPDDYRGFAYQQDGRWLEGWDGIALVDSGTGVEQALAAHDRLWLVIDEHRFHNRFADGFVQAVWNGMDLVWRDQQVMIFYTADPPPPVTYQARQIQLWNPAALVGGRVALKGYALETEPKPGQTLPLTLYWSAEESLPGPSSTFVHLVDANGTGWTQDDGPPLGEIYPTTNWRPGEVLRDRKSLPLPANLPAGLYRLEAGMYDPATMAHWTTEAGAERVILGFIRIGAGEVPCGDAVLVPSLDSASEAVPGMPHFASPLWEGQLAKPSLGLGKDGVGPVFDKQIRLSGYAPVSCPRWRSEACVVLLAWTAEDLIGEDYAVFVHLVDEEGQIRAQDDGPPGGGFYPTSFWEPGKTMLDRRELNIAGDTPAGVYYLRVGLYQPETGRRLTTPEGDYVELETWTLPSGLPW